jgi:hypothetical protein
MDAVQAPPSSVGPADRSFLEPRSGSNELSIKVRFGVVASRAARVNIATR